MFLGQSIPFWVAAGVFMLAAITLLVRMAGAARTPRSKPESTPAQGSDPRSGARLSLTPTSGGEPLILSAEELRRAHGISIGRTRAFCDVVLTDRQISRRHCRLTEKDGVIYVEDLSSTHGVRIDDAAIVAFRPAPLADGATLRLADINFWVAIGSA